MLRILSAHTDDEQCPVALSPKPQKIFESRWRSYFCGPHCFSNRGNTIFPSHWKGVTWIAAPSPNLLRSCQKQAYPSFQALHWRKSSAQVIILIVNKLSAGKRGPLRRTGSTPTSIDHQSFSRGSVVTFPSQIFVLLLSVVKGMIRIWFTCEKATSQTVTRCLAEFLSRAWEKKATNRVANVLRLHATSVDSANGNVMATSRYVGRAKLSRWSHVSILRTNCWESGEKWN